MSGADWFASALATVEASGQQLREIQGKARTLAETINPVGRGYFTASEDEQAQQLLVTYVHVRRALFELLDDCERLRRTNAGEDEEAIFAIGFVAALQLVDAARFLREVTEGRAVVRHRLNQPVPSFGILGGTYDTVQRSLLSVRHAWRLMRARCFWECMRPRWLRMPIESPQRVLCSMIDRLMPRLDVSIDQFGLHRLRTRADQWLRHAGRVLIAQQLYGLQRCVSSMMADVYLRAGHRPSLPVTIGERMAASLRPGDVLVVRKEFALTNYFLPGYWPHAALYVGPLTMLGFDLDPAIDVNADRSPSTAALRDPPTSSPCVVEAMKDGVRVRDLSSPFSSDSIVVLRPQLTPNDIATAIQRVRVHLGKPYDFDFDFRRVDRLVCTEVIYRAYDGLDPIRFDLRFRVGRPTLSGSDLIEMAQQRQGFEIEWAYVPEFCEELCQGAAAEQCVQEVVARRSAS